MTARARVSALGVCLLVPGLGCDETRLDAFLAPYPGDAATGGAPQVVARCNPCTDFPAAAILDTENGSSVPDNVADLFGPEGAGAAGVGPCLFEPELGSIFPKNWLRPRFRFIPAAGQSLFEIRLKAARQQNPLVVYSSATSWTLPASIWRAITENLVEEPITVSIRGLDPSASPVQPSLATTGTITVSPAAAEGNIVYWSTVFFPDTQTGSSILKGFAIGDETVREVLRPEQTGGACPACHTATPDGLFLGVSVSSVINNGEPAHIELRSTDGAGAEPDFLSADARLLLAREQQQLPTFSTMHWRAGDRLMLSNLNLQMIWTDLEATSQTEGAAWGILTRRGDLNPVVTHPAFNAAGTALAYTSAASGALTKADVTDVYVVPFNAGQGGEATPLPGASTPETNEYYPAFSSDDALVAFNRAPLAANAPDDPDLAFSSKTTYNNPLGEILVVSSQGGSPERLLANDPPACTGKQSPGVGNSWGKWAPEASAVGDKTFYWLTFSSGRVDLARPQLYIAPVVVDAGGRVSTYPALYLWNQPSDEGNHTPAWGL